MQIFKTNWRLVLAFAFFLVSIFIWQKWVTPPYPDFILFFSSVSFGFLVGFSISVKFYHPFMSDEECKALAEKKLHTIFGRADFEVSGTDIVDTNANPELQKYRGYAPISGIMWNVRATNNDGKIAQVFGDVKLKNSTTHTELGEVVFETPLLREIKRTAVKIQYPKTGNIKIDQPKRIIREERVHVEVKK